MLQNNGVRISQIISHFCGTKANFAREIGESYNTVNNWVARDNGKSVLDKVIKAFPNVSPSWLMYGEGEMLRSDSTQQPNPQNSEKQVFDDEPKENLFSSSMKKVVEDLGSKVAMLTLENRTLLDKLEEAREEIKRLKSLEQGSDT